MILLRIALVARHSSTTNRFVSEVWQADSENTASVTSFNGKLLRIANLMEKIPKERRSSSLRMNIRKFYSSEQEYYDEANTILQGGGRKFMTVYKLLSAEYNGDKSLIPWQVFTVR